MRTALLLITLAPSFALAQAADADSVRQVFEQGDAALNEGRYPDAEAAYEKLLRLDPSLAEAHARLGLVYFQEKKFAQAVPALRRALKLKPTLPNTGILLAMSLAEIGHYEEALPGLEKGFRDSSDPVLKRMSGLELERVYTGLQRDEKAVGVALELSRTYPKDPEVLYNTGRLFGNFAYLTLRKLAAVAPDSVWRRLAAGEAYESQGDDELAVMEYREVLAQGPGRPGIHYRIGRALLAGAARNNSRTEGAEQAAKEFERELEIDATNANAAYELGEIRRKAGRFVQARGLFESAVQYDPEFEEAEIGLGRTLIALGKFDLALSHLKKAAALNPANDVTYYQLAQVYGKLGDPAERDRAIARFQNLRSAKAVPDIQIKKASQVTKQRLDPEAVR